MSLKKSKNCSWGHLPNKIVKFQLLLRDAILPSIIF